MFEFIRAHQLNSMLVLCGIPGIISVFVLLTTTLSRRRKIALFALEMSSMFLLIFDRFAYIYRGDTSQLGIIMVRLCNFMVFALNPAIVGFFNLYIIDLFTNEGGMKNEPKRLTAIRYLSFIGVLLVVISQFTGFYYTFDSTNHYQRAPGFIICYIIPILGLILQLSVIIQHGKRLNVGIHLSIILFTAMVIIASFIQIFAYGLSLTNMTCVGMAVLLYIFALVDMNKTAEKAHRQEIEYLEEARESMRRLFEQTTTAFVDVLDAKNKYTVGHSRRVARYSKRIAELSGMSEEECDEVYFSALLHDVGKLAIPESIITKNARLSDEENELYMKHCELGNQILSSITDYSNISEGAFFHHERYDGGGYPQGLKGEKIPEVARIIAIADFYDILTSKRSYRGRLPQTRVREEFVKETGERFDPKYAKILLQMMAADVDYKMKDSAEDNADFLKRELHIEEYRSDFSSGIHTSNEVMKMTFKYSPEKTSDDQFSVPAIILYDSLDGLVHTTERDIKDNTYVEFGEIFFDGHTVCSSARDIICEVTDKKQNEHHAEDGMFEDSNKDYIQYSVEYARLDDHVQLSISGDDIKMNVTAALMDNSRYSYLSVTGEHCYIRDIDITSTDEVIHKGDIKRIADEIIYTNRLESDLKNIQIDSYRSASTKGVPLVDGLKIAFETISLPAAYFVWHCPSVIIYSSDDGQVNGNNYREYALIRIDGETGDKGSYADNKITVVRNDNFESWDEWKKINRKGMECILYFEKAGNRVLTKTENAGINIKNITTIKDNTDNIYVALTGDCCAITDIRVFNE